MTCDDPGLMGNVVLHHLGTTMTPLKIFKCFCRNLLKISRIHFLIFVALGSHWRCWESIPKRVNSLIQEEEGSRFEPDGQVWLLCLETVCSHGACVGFSGFSGFLQQLTDIKVSSSDYLPKALALSLIGDLPRVEARLSHSVSWDWFQVPCDHDD